MYSCQIYCVQYSVLQSLLCILFVLKSNLNIQQEPVCTSKIQQKLFSGRGSARTHLESLQRSPRPTSSWGRTPPPLSAVRASGCGHSGLASPLTNYPPHFQIPSDATVQYTTTIGTIYCRSTCTCVMGTVKSCIRNWGNYFCAQ